MARRRFLRSGPCTKLISNLSANNVLWLILGHGLTQRECLQGLFWLAWVTQEWFHCLKCSVVKWLGRSGPQSRSVPLTLTDGWLAILAPSSHRSLLPNGPWLYRPFSLFVSIKIAMYCFLSLSLSEIWARNRSLNHCCCLSANSPP